MQGTRLSGQEYTITEMLADGKERYGLEMVKKSNGKLGRASVYVVLTRMVAHGLLEARFERDDEQKMAGPKRRLYKLTGYGRKVYEAQLAAEQATARVMRGVLKPAGSM